MAHVIEVPHLELHDNDDLNLNINDSPPRELQPTGQGPAQSQAQAATRIRSPRLRYSPSVNTLMTALRTPRRLKIVSAVVGMLAVVAVSVALAVHYSKGTKATQGKPTIPVSPQTAEPTPFLKIIHENDGTAIFVLSKQYWNASFMVYPTVVKHAAPPRMGFERGSILLDTSDYVFHFEKTFDERFLVLVLENHRTRLRDEADELKKVFDTSQWPGYVTSIAIYMETEDAFHFATEPFLANGFFVSSKLVSPYFSAIPDSSGFYPRNTNFQVEYELDDGVVWVNYAVGLLPETVLAQRAADDRVGYFTQRYTRYGVDNNDVANLTTLKYETMDSGVTIINRRRLELNGQGKTKDPIVFYIDPSVPARWRQAFAAGVTAWQPAFTAIGFPDAIKAVLPGDPDWPADYRIGDLRYNSISVMISEMTYAYGPSVVDPRSGEILHSDITFEYGFFNEVIADFDVRSPVDPPSAHVARREQRKRRMRSHETRPEACGFGHSPRHQADRVLLSMALGGKAGAIPSAIIGRHFTDIVMHEVGHTLGLRHNFAGTTAITRAQLSDQTYTSVNGLSSSIMDYIAVNIFSDLTDNAKPTHDFYQTVIGAYDKAAIAYGYKPLDDEKPGHMSPKLAALAKAAPLFLTDEDADLWTNPMSQRFDISSDPIDYANDRLELVKALRATIISKIPEDASWTALWRYEAALLSMVNATIDVVQPFLGGVKVTHAHRKANENAYTPEYVSKADQTRALAVLQRIISADTGVFPDPTTYGSYINVMGYPDEDCRRPSNDYGCLARGLVDIDAAVLSVRRYAVIAALFPALDRIIAQDVNSPLTLADVLGGVNTAASNKPQLAQNQALKLFFANLLHDVVENKDGDERLIAELATFVNSTLV
ncbi:hypothetical protein ATCC90586_001061 [Pythium insidiosum]|nr:hypothetical protein ATCC90586_001061 [Pythium insidiosum]